MIKLSQQVTLNNNTISLTYTFNNDLSGSAAGVVELCSSTGGKYHLFWGKNGNFLKVNCGEKILRYSSVLDFNFSCGETRLKKNVLAFIAIPVETDCIILTNEERTPLITIKIPEQKLLPCIPHKYSFGVIADIHYNYFFNHDKTVDYAVDAIDRALDFSKKSGTKAVCAIGDYGIYSEEKSYQDYKKAVDKSGVTVIACGGNHELYAKLDVMYGENGYWRTYMNKGIYDKTLPGVLDIAENGIDFSYSFPEFPNEVFVSLSQRYWDGHTDKQPMLVEPSQLEWLKQQFELYKDKTVILLFHTYLSDEDGYNITGQGDLLSTGGYSYNGHYNYHTPDEKILRKLFHEYKNVIWFNGHSHYEYCMQVYNENLNIYSYEATTATMIHVPSVTNPRTVKPDSNHYSSLRGYASQGALEFVYDGFHIMNGTDLWNDEIQSYACYIIYTQNENIIQSGELSNSNIKWCFSKQLNTLRIDGEGILESCSDFDKFKDDVYHVYISKGIDEISDNTFKDFKNLKYITLKDGVSTIRKNAFSSSRLVRILLPESIKIIKEGAFNRESPIDEVKYAGTKENWNEIAIEEHNGAISRVTHFNKRKVDFVVEGKTTSYDVTLGKSPCFEGIPIKNHSDEDKYYVFAGWSDATESYDPGTELPKVSDNVTYFAKFGSEDTRFVSGVLEESKVSWKLDRKNSTLTLDGNGNIPDYVDLTLRPWNDYCAAIEHIVVGGGIKSIGNCAFKQITSLKSVKFEEGVVSLGNDCIGYNKYLKEVYIPRSLNYIGKGCVYQTDNIKTVYYYGTKSMWQDFCQGVTTYYNTNLTNVKNVICEDE